jgi:type II secretory pathway pseudopilin PulG
MARSARRPAFTLVEVLLVLAVLIILGAILIPSLTTFRADTRQRATADAVRGELAVARARAKENGQPVRIALSSDGTRIRRGPDGADFANATAATANADSQANIVDYAFEQPVTVKVVPENNVIPPEESGWVTVATVQPDGTCLETTVLLAIADGDGVPLYVRVRGLTTTAKVVPAPSGAGGSTGGTP